MTKKFRTIKEVLWWMIETDDKNRDKVCYDVGITVDRAEKMILNLKVDKLEVKQLRLKDLVKR